MKSFIKNVGVLLALLLTGTLQISAENNSSVPQVKHIDSKFLLKGNDILDPRTVEKIDTMGKELFVKTGVNVYVYASKRYANKEFNDTKSKIEFIKSFESNITKELKKPYALLTLSFEDKHVNILWSSELNGMIDKSLVLNDFIIPLLSSPADKNPLEAKVSVALLNGYSALADSIANGNEVEMESTIHGNGQIVAKIWKILMYIIIFIGLSVYFYAIWKEKRQ
jgi:hypothetical protein